MGVVIHVNPVQEDVLQTIYHTHKYRNPDIKKLVEIIDLLICFWWSSGERGIKEFCFKKY